MLTMDARCCVFMSCALWYVAGVMFLVVKETSKQSKASPHYMIYISRSLGDRRGITEEIATTTNPPPPPPTHTHTLLHLVLRRSQPLARWEICSVVDVVLPSLCFPVFLLIHAKVNPTPTTIPPPPHPKKKTPNKQTNKPNNNKNKQTQKE